MESKEGETITQAADVVSPASSPASASDEILSADEQLLRAQGHKGELPRQFSSFAALSMGFVITNSWIGYSATFVTPLWTGGGPMVFFGVIVAAIACFIITAGLAELASAFPSSGGQYHFAFMVASPKSRALAAFVMGWMSTLAWVLTASSAVVYCAQIVMFLAEFFNTDFIAERWQVYLVVVLFSLICGAIVIFAPKAMPQFEMVFFWSTLLGFVTAFITVLAASKTKQPGHVIFADWNNQSGWGDGTAFMLGLGTCMYAFLATDAVTHIAEEVPNPGYYIPRVMCLTIFIGVGTVVPFTLAFMFSTNDLEAIANAPLPILEVYHQATGSKAGAAVFTTWLLFNYFGAAVSCIATSGRLAWAFARDDGLPFSKVFAKVHPTLKTPSNATILCTLFCIAYSAIYIGSTTAFNSIISMSILALNITYVIPQGILLFRGRDKVLPARSFRLGVFGPFMNAFSCLWVALYTVLFCFPVFLPATVDNMNYLSVVLVGIVILIVAFWFGGKRHTFTGPDINLEGIEATQERILNEKQPHKLAGSVPVGDTADV